MNQANPTNQFSHFIWHNKIFLTIIICLTIFSAIFIDELGALVGFLVVFGSAIIAYKHKSFASLGLKKPASWGKTILFGLVLGVGIELSFQLIFNHLIELITKAPIDLTSLDPLRGNFLISFFTLLLGWFVGGFLEEVTFRGYLITKLREVFGDSSAKTIIYLLLSAIPFGLAHMYQDWAGVFSTGSIGLIIAIIYVRSKSNLWLAVFTHGFANTVGITLIYTSWDQFFLNFWK